MHLLAEPLSAKNTEHPRPAVARAAAAGPGPAWVLRSPSPADRQLCSAPSVGWSFCARMSVSELPASTGSFVMKVFCSSEVSWLFSLFHMCFWTSFETLTKNPVGILGWTELNQCISFRRTYISLTMPSCLETPPFSLLCRSSLMLFSNVSYFLRKSLAYLLFCLFLSTLYFFYYSCKWYIS